MFTNMIHGLFSFTNIGKSEEKPLTKALIPIFCAIITISTVGLLIKKYCFSSQSTQSPFHPFTPEEFEQISKARQSLSSTIIEVAFTPEEQKSINIVDLLVDKVLENPERWQFKDAFRSSGPDKWLNMAVELLNTAKTQEEYGRLISFLPPPKESNAYICLIKRICNKTEKKEIFRHSKLPGLLSKVCEDEKCGLDRTTMPIAFPACKHFFS